MGGYADKVQKSAADKLRPGEQVVSAIRTQPSGTVVATGVGGLVGQAIASKQHSKAHAQADEGSIAKGWATGKFAVALTDQRLLTFNFTFMGAPKDLTSDLSLDQVQNIELNKKKITNGVLFSFVDGSAVEVEVGKLEKTDDFVGAFQRVKAGSAT